MLLPISWRRKWQPAPVFLHGEFHGWRSLAGYSLWGPTELHKKVETTERLHFHFSLSFIGEGNGNPLQCSCLKNPRGGEAWWAAVCGVAQSWTRLKRLNSINLMLSLFLTLAVLVSVEQYLVILICIFLIANDIEHLCMDLFDICIS